MNIFFAIEGGIGKHIMSTAIIQAIKKKHPKDDLHVFSAYPDVFLNNPYIFKNYSLDQQAGIYERLVEGQKFKAYVADPYKHHSFISKEKHLIKVWCEQFGLKYQGEKPEIYLTQEEINYYKPFYLQSDKPLFVMQPNGGPINQSYNYAWTRDLPEPLVMAVIEEYKSTHTIVHVKHENQKVYPDTLHAMDGWRSIAILLTLADKRLLIDSYSQHLAKALGVKSTVCWITTKPEVFGYSLHDNIVAEPFTKRPIVSHASYDAFNLSQDISSLAYNDLNEIFNPNKVIDSLKK